MEHEQEDGIVMDIHKLRLLRILSRILSQIKPDVCLMEDGIVMDLAEKSDNIT